MVAAAIDADFGGCSVAAVLLFAARVGKKSGTLSIKLAGCKTLARSSHTTQAASLHITSYSRVCHLSEKMQSSLCFALLATAAALQAPTSPTAMRRGVVARAPVVDVLAPTSTALCAGADDDYTAPKIEFDPDAPTGGRDLWRDGVELNL